MAARFVYRDVRWRLFKLIIKEELSTLIAVLDVVYVLLHAKKKR